MRKHIILFVIAVLSCLQLSAQSSNNASPKHEFRATWFTTVANIDWPKTKVTSDATREQQKAELVARFDELAANNINAVLFQVRGRSDAFYNSNYEPWAVELTGSTLGTDPGYDPLKFAIDEAHKRGMELHAWINPFRIATAESNQMTVEKVNTLYKAPDSKEKLKWDWVLSYYTKTKKQDRDSLVYQIVDPGNPDAREYVVNVMMDIVTNYDIDGVVMDDYFYAYAGTTDQDQASQDAYYTPNKDKITDQDGDGDTLDDWRRSNVDAVIADFSSQVRTAKPWVRFGMGPGGIWTMQSKAATAYGIQLPYNIVGADLYELLGCNTVEWIKNGWVDYVCPQIYWATTARQQDYDVLCKWWAKDVCEHFSDLLSGEQRVHFYPSHAGYKVYEYKNKNTKERHEGFGDNEEEGKQEMINQIESNRQNLSSGYTGSVYFSNKDFVKMSSEIKAACYQQKALVPPMAWKSTEELDAPNTLRISGKTLTWAHDNADRFMVYIYPKGVRMSQAIEDVNYLQGVVYGTEFTLPNSFDITTHNVAVRSYDRYGVEHEAAEYGPDVTYVLNGGIVKYEAQITVPTNEELWEQFKTAFNEFNGLNKVDQPITNCGGFTYTNSGTPCLDMLTSAESGWKWLGDYLVKTATAAGKTCATNAAFRWNLDAFFNAYAGKNDALGVDYTTAGQPSAWGPAYIAAHSGTIVEPQPAQEELKVQFMDGYLEYFKNKIDKSTCSNTNTFYTNKDISGFLAHGASNSSGHEHSIFVSDMMTDANSDWKWLGDYIIKVSGSFSLDSDARWRHSITAFFNQSGATAYTVDFSTAGQREAWEAAWDAAHPATPADPETSTYTLPDFIKTDLTLPTEDSRPVYITHPSGYSLLGWYYYDAQEQTLKQITTLPADYKGTVYAQWNSPIKWVLNGGVYTGKGDLPLHVHDTYILPTAFTMRKDGHKFVGWYTASDFSGNKLTSIDADYTGTLYAKWAKATHVTWHPYPYYDVTNEDLWELFVEDYNAFYTNKEILGENRSYENRAYQPIGNVFGFMHSGEKLKNANGEWINKEGAVVGTEAEAHHRFPDGRAMDFMTHPQSPWKWLGDYVVETIEAGKGSEDSNEPLWSAFKEATGLTNLSTLKNYEEKGTGFTSIAGALNGEKLTTLFADEKWACLKSYIMTVQNAVKGTVIGQTTNAEGKLVDITIIELKSTIADSERAWCYAVAAFFLQDQRTVWPASANFSDAGRHTVWMEAIEQMGTEAAEEFHELGHFRISSEKEWRKQIAGFFNHSDFIKYVFPVGSKDSILEETADFRVSGLPKPNGDPAAGWYNAWWNATFPEYMIDNEALPKIKRKNYVFGGWYYGNDKGYIFTEGTKADPAAYSSANDNYKNHLWGRWLELCLYEGYVDPDPAALDKDGQAISSKVNNNVEMVICNAEEINQTGLSRKVDIERKLTGGTYNTMFLPFGINGAGGKVDDVQMNGKEYYLRQVVDDNGNQLLNPATTSILVYDGAEVEDIGGEEVIAFNFHEYAEENSSEPLFAYQPFLIKPENDITVRMHFWSALMQPPTKDGARTTADQARVEGVLAPTMLPVNPEHDNTLILVADNRLAKVTTQGEMLGLRLYFTVPKDVSPSARSIIRVNNSTTDVDNIPTVEEGTTAVKFLHNGVIYILRGDEVYSIMGDRVR